MEYVKTGEWDGEPIYRQKTAYDRLMEELYGASYDPLTDENDD